MDQHSGFIHLSARDQVAETTRRVFADQPVLVIAAIDESIIGGSLRREITPDRERFPHPPE